jgi:hypothetical protein
VRYWRVKLPPGVRSPFEVYVNGVRQERELVRQRLGVKAWLLGFWGIGTYKRNDEIDIRYEAGGQPQVARVTEITAPPPEKS